MIRRVMMTRPFLATVLLIASMAIAGAEPSWTVGLGKSKITPERPQWMAGYAARTGPSEGTESDLWARAAIFEDAQGQTSLLISLDLVGIDRNLSATLVKQIETKYRIPRAAIVIATTHTHCGPLVGSTLRTMYFLDAGQAERVREYTESLPGLVMQAVAAAASNRQPSKISFHPGRATFAVNRRENPETAVPGLREQNQLKGPVDHDVPVLAIRSPQGKLRGLIFGYACHATTLSFQKWSGDYPGYAAAELEALDPAMVAIFVAGCGADQNPIPRRSLALAKQYGHELATAVQAALEQSSSPIAPRWRGGYEEIKLPLASVPSREELLRQTEDKNPYVVSRAKMLLARLDNEKALAADYPYPIQVWGIGSLTWIFLGGEVVVDFSLRFKKELPNQTLWISAYCNDVMAYIPSERVLKEGGYEGSGAMVYYGLPSAWAPGIEDRIITAVHAMQKRIKE